MKNLSPGTFVIAFNNRFSWFVFALNPDGTMRCILFDWFTSTKCHVLIKTSCLSHPTEHHNTCKAKHRCDMLDS